MFCYAFPRSFWFASGLRLSGPATVRFWPLSATEGPLGSNCWDLEPLKFDLADLPPIEFDLGLLGFELGATALDAEFMAFEGERPPHPRCRLHGAERRRVERFLRERGCPP